MSGRDLRGVVPNAARGDRRAILPLGDGMANLPAHSLDTPAIAHDLPHLR